MGVKKDRKFKNIIKLSGFKKIKISSKFYNPDVFFAKRKTLVVFESSSTGDRKVHIGEVDGFLRFLISCKDYDEFYFILYLCGASDSSPKVEKEIQRIRFCYNTFPLSSLQKEKIKGIFVSNQPDDDKLSNLDLNDDILSLENLKSKS